MFCVCQGTCPSFAKENAYEITNMTRKDFNVDFVVIHPQLCADDGDRFPRTLLKNTEIDTISKVKTELEKRKDELKF